MITIIVSGLIAVTGIVALIVIARKTDWFDSGWFLVGVIVTVISGVIFILSCFEYNSAVVTIDLFNLTVTPEQYMVLSEEGRAALIGTNNHVFLETVK